MATKNTPTKKYQLAKFIVDQGADGATREQIAKAVNIDPATVPVHMWALRQAGMKFKDSKKGDRGENDRLKPYIAIGGIPSTIKEFRGNPNAEPKAPSGKRAAAKAQKAAKATKTANTATTSTGDKQVDKQMKKLHVAADKAVKTIENAVAAVEKAARRH